MKIHNDSPTLAKRDKSQPKNILILFSGGLDSTALLYKQLTETKNNIKVAYVDIKNNVNKTIAEKKSRTKILNILNKQYPHRIETIPDNVELGIPTGNYSCYGLPQLNIWLFSAVYLCRHIDEMHIGYVCGDEAISFIDDIQRTWRAIQILHPELKNTNLKFPLKKHLKTELYHGLPSDIREHLHWCENPKINDNDIINCNKCRSCLRWNMLNYESFSVSPQIKKYEPEVTMGELIDAVAENIDTFDKDSHDVKKPTETSVSSEDTTCQKIY